MRIGKPKESGPKIRKGRDDGSTGPKKYFRAEYGYIKSRNFTDPPFGWFDSAARAAREGIEDKKLTIEILKEEISNLRKIGRTK